MSAPKVIAAAVPGPAVLFVGEWLDLFTNAGLASPEWQVGAHSAALAIGAFVALVLSILLKSAGGRTLHALAWGLFILTVVALGACLAIRFHLRPPTPGGLAVTDPDFWRELWRLIYIVAMVLLVATVAVASLTLEKKSAVLFWILAALSLTIVMGGVWYFFMR